MKTPESLVPVLDSGVIQEVVRPLMSGKEAQIYIVLAQETECVAKVYKEASQRTFKHRSEYTEGRRGRNTRDQRAINKRSRHGRQQDEAGWRSTEVGMIYRLRAAGVRVPEPINFVEGVLVMELVRDAHGEPASRLGDLRFEPDEAIEIYQKLLREVVCMLAEGIIHGDLSDFNVLLAADGPVLIDFPQSVEAASNQNARKLLLRDVENLHRFVKRHAPAYETPPYAEEMWALYEVGKLERDTELSGDFRESETQADVGEVIALIEDSDRDEDARREARGEEAPTPVTQRLRRLVDFTTEPSPLAGGRRPHERNARPDARGGRAAVKPDADKAASGTSDQPPKKRRNRRRRRGGASRGGARDEKRSVVGETGATSHTEAKRRPQPSRNASSSRPSENSTQSDGRAVRPRRRRRRPRKSTSPVST